MLDLHEIEDTIKDIENKNTTLDNCRILADMLIIQHFYNSSKNGVEEELSDILPQYRNYCKVKRRYQRKETSEAQVLNSLRLVCSEIEDFFHTLYSSTDMPEEREQLKGLIQGLSVAFNK